MTIDGRAFASLIKKEIKSKIEQIDRRFSLVVFVTAEDLGTKKFIEIKKKFAEDIGIFVEVKRISTSTTEKLVSEIKHAAESFDGIIVQFPLKSDLDVNLVRNAIPVSHDVDVISDSAISRFEKGELPVLPPVVGAIAKIIEEHNIDIKGKRVVVVGAGRLVGKPSATWFERAGAKVDTVTVRTSNTLESAKKADIIVLGAGSPNLLKPDMIKEGVVIFDAGTSEASGKLVGDADPMCAEKASLFTPVPGGIGPITVAMIFKNLLALKGVVK